MPKRMNTNLHDYLLKLAEKAGVQDLEEYQEAIKAAVVTGNRKLIDRVERELKELSVEEPYDFIRPPANKIAGPIDYGNEITRGYRAGFEISDLAHMIVVGKTQHGKTNLAKVLTKKLTDDGITVHVFDPKGSFKEVIHSIPSFYVLNLMEDLKWNPLAPPVENPNMNKFWRSKVVEIFNQLFDLLSGSGSLAQRAIFDIYKKAEQKGVYPTINDLGDYINLMMDKKLKNRSVKYQYAERLGTRLDSLMAMAGEVLTPQRGFPIQDLARENICFEWGIADTRIERFLILSLLLSQYHWRLSTYKNRGQIDTVIIIDEAEAIFDPRDDQSSKKGVPFSKVLSSRSRELGLSLLGINQNPYLSSGLRDNSQTVISFAPGDEHRHQMARLMGLTPKQAEALSLLEVGQCVVKMGRYPEPFVVKVDLYDE